MPVAGIVLFISSSSVSSTKLMTCCPVVLSASIRIRSPSLVLLSAKMVPFPWIRIAFLNGLSSFNMSFDVKRVAALEFQYFDVHRRLSGKGEKKELLQTLIALRSTIL